MNQFTIVAGVDGTGKSSLRGVLDGQAYNLGKVIDADAIAKANHFSNVSAGKFALKQIDECLSQNRSFTQETTLSGKGIIRTMQRARQQGYYITMCYVGLDSAQESLKRIANRVEKGGHNIPQEDVLRRYANRFDAFKQALPLCDEVHIYDNNNGFVKVAEVKNDRFIVFENCPIWAKELAQYCK